MQMQGYDQQGKMEENEIKMKQKRMLNIIQICLRALALVTSIASTWLMLISNQTTFVYGVQMDAKYSYSSAFEFFAFAYAIASVFALLSLALTLFLWYRGLETTNTLFFIHDLVIMSLLLAGCSATMAVAYIGKYGNSHTGWIPICDNFHIFCNRVMVAVVLGCFAIICFICLTILSSIKSSIHILPFQV